VGSYLKKDGVAKNDVELDRVQKLMITVSGKPVSILKEN
jgi:predicted TIM-barrel enzyme